jgi:hypothetical protein
MFLAWCFVLTLAQLRRSPPLREALLQCLEENSKRRFSVLTLSVITTVAIALLVFARRR